MSTDCLVDRHMRERISSDRHACGYPFVTISRQAGAGGRSLAGAIVGRLRMDARSPDLGRGWQVADRNLCEELLQDPDIVNVSLRELETEEFNGPVEDFMVEVLGQRTSQFEIYRRLFAIMRRLASVGKVILIGRGGACVTRNLPGGIHIRLTAPLELRVERMRAWLGVSESEAVEEIRRQDLSRRRMLSQIFGKDVRDPEIYEQVYDTGAASIDAIADECVERIQSIAKSIGRV